MCILLNGKAGQKRGFDVISLRNKLSIKVYAFRTRGDIKVSFVSLPVKGMGIIEQLDPMSFTNYLKKYRNTICGRHPIGVLLNVSTTGDERHHVY